MGVSVTTSPGKGSTTCGKTWGIPSPSALAAIPQAYQAALEAHLTPLMTPAVSWSGQVDQLSAAGATPYRMLPAAPFRGLAFKLSDLVPYTPGATSIPFKFDYFIGSAAAVAGFSILVTIRDSVSGNLRTSRISPAGPLPPGYGTVTLDYLAGTVIGVPTGWTVTAVSGPFINPNNSEVFVTFDIPAVAMPPGTYYDILEISQGIRGTPSSEYLAKDELGKEATLVKSCPQQLVTVALEEFTQTQVAPINGRDLYISGANLIEHNADTNTPAVLTAFVNTPVQAIAVPKDNYDILYFIGNNAGTPALFTKSLNTPFTETLIGNMTLPVGATAWSELAFDGEGNLYATCTPAPAGAIGNLFLVNRSTAATTTLNKLLPITGTSSPLAIYGVPGQPGGRVFSGSGVNIVEINWAATTGAVTSSTILAATPTNIRALELTTDARLLVYSGAGANTLAYSLRTATLSGTPFTTHAPVTGGTWRSGTSSISLTRFTRNITYDCSGSVLCSRDSDLLGNGYSVLNIANVRAQSLPQYHEEVWRLRATSLVDAATPGYFISALRTAPVYPLVGRNAQISAPYKAIAWRFMPDSAANGVAVIGNRSFTAQGSLFTEGGLESDVNEGDGDLNQSLLIQALNGAHIEVRVLRRLY